MIAGHPVDIARSVSINVGGCCAHEGHSYTFAPLSVAFPLLGGTLTITDTAHSYDVIFGVPRPQAFHATFPAEPATLVLAIEPSVPIPTLMPVGLCALGVLVAVLGIFAAPGKSV